MIRRYTYRERVLNSLIGWLSNWAEAIAEEEWEKLSKRQTAI